MLERVQLGRSISGAPAPVARRQVGRPWPLRGLGAAPLRPGARGAVPAAAVSDESAAGDAWGPVMEPAAILPPAEDLLAVGMSSSQSSNAHHAHAQTAVTVHEWPGAAAAASGCAAAQAVAEDGGCDPLPQGVFEFDQSWAAFDASSGADRSEISKNIEAADHSAHELQAEGLPAAVPGQQPEQLTLEEDVVVPAGAEAAALVAQEQEGEEVEGVALAVGVEPFAQGDVERVEVAQQLMEGAAADAAALPEQHTLLYSVAVAGEAGAVEAAAGARDGNGEAGKAVSAAAIHLEEGRAADADAVTAVPFLEDVAAAVAVLAPVAEEPAKRRRAKRGGAAAPVRPVNPLAAAAAELLAVAHGGVQVVADLAWDTDVELYEEVQTAAGADGPLTLASSSPLAGGTLEVVRWRKDRMLRVWTPPGYTRADASKEPYPVMYLNDGQNLFDETLSLSGSSWRAAEAAAEAISSGALPPFVIVGIDHAGAARSFDYLPCEPGTAHGYRSDAAQWPGGGADRYLQAVVEEVVPFAERQYFVSSDPALRVFGGSSFGGINALCAAMRYPGMFGGLLVESPSLWFGEERMLRQDVPRFAGDWPGRVFLAMGTQEYSGLRKGEGPEFDELLVQYTHELADLLQAQGVTEASARLQVVVEEAATHTESAWAGRLPAALRHLGAPWWRAVLSRRSDCLYFTLPRKLRAGAPAVLFFNPAKSATLAACPPDQLKLAYGFNVNWSVGAGRLPLEPAAGLAAGLAAAPELELTLPLPADEEEEEELHEGDVAEGPLGAVEEDLAAEAALAAAAAATINGQLEAQAAARAAAPPKARPPAEGDAAPARRSPPAQPRADATPAGAAAGSCRWLQACFVVPPEAYEMHLAFTDGGSAWDNNAGSNFYSRVKMPMSASQKAQSLADALTEATSWGNVEEAAARHQRQLYFTTPATLVAGQPAVVYINRKASPKLRDNPNIKLHFGFDSWAHGSSQVDLKPTSLWRHEHVDWWAAPMTVPRDMSEMSFALTDGHGVWDSNNGKNYKLHVKTIKPKATPVARTVHSVETSDHAGGQLHVLTLGKRAGAGARSSKWTEEKRVRVWTPPGFDAANPPPGGWPVLLMNDGQNMFEDWLAHQGVSWRVAYTAADLIGRRELPPFVVVAIDSAGAMRSLNYLPFPPGTGAGAFRGDAERWPGGGLEDYMVRLVEEILPMLRQRYGLASDPAKVAFGGGSFAGVAALYAAMHYPHVFGAVLAESPSLWVGEGRFLADLAAHKGMLPERLFLGCGTREYSATRDHVRDDVDALLLHYCCEAARILDERGLRGERMRFLVEEGAGHHELAWQWRLTGALRFLLAPWWNE